MPPCFAHHYKVRIKGKVDQSMEWCSSYQKRSLQITLSHSHQLYFDRPIDLVVECSPMAWETGVQSQVESYQRLRKWHLIPPCLTLSIIRYVSRVKWSNPEKGVAFSPTPQCSNYWKGSFRVALDNGHQLYLLTNVHTCIDWIVYVNDCHLSWSFK